MADFAIGLSFHKAHRTLVRAAALKPPCRYFATRSGDGMITLPVLDPGDQYIELQGISQTSFQINDNDQEFRLLGDDGWSDSVITGSRVQASNTAYFSKDTEIPAGQKCPIFRGNYDEGFALIERSRHTKDVEIYLEYLKELGPINGTSGNWIYDFTGFNAVVMNYNESMSAEGLTEVTFDFMSRGRPVFGRYDAGPLPLSIGGVQSSLLQLVPGSRQVAIVPAANSSTALVTDPLTATYTTNGTAPLTELFLGQADGSGFALLDAVTGARVPCAVALAANVVTITPAALLEPGTIYRLIVSDGAVTQAVDGTGTASPTGMRRPLQGTTSVFRTEV